MEKQKVLEIKDLEVRFLTEEDTVCAVNGIDLSINQGESLGLVGETGAGKTTTCLAIMQLIPDPPGLITKGEITFCGENMLQNTEKKNAEIRGKGISMIFQDPMTALNPVMTVGEQLMEVVRTHEKLSKAQAKEKVIRALEIVGVKSDRFNDYPHQFSGGLIADEPTTALDVTIQAQVLELIKNLQEKTNTAMLLVTHDLGVVAETCDKVAIMYAGEIVEYGTVEEVFRNALHPYTKGLFESIPKMTGDSKKLIPIEGMPPNPADLPRGCCFHPRCRYCTDKCKIEKPVLRGEGHLHRCHNV